MSTSPLPRRCLSCLQATRILRHRPLAPSHGQIQWFSKTRIWGQYSAETVGEETTISSEESLEPPGSFPSYQCSIYSRSLSLFTSGQFLLPRFERRLGHSTPLLVLFVSRALSSLLNEGSPFLKHILGRVFSRLEIGRRIDLLAAVVDSIPHIPVQYFKPTGAGVPSNHALGFDGISLQLCESHVAAPDLWSPREESHEQDSMDIQQRSTVSFLYGRDTKFLQWASERFLPVTHTTHLLELPLANTMFHNAQTSTMFAQRWTVTEKGEDAQFDCIEQIPLTQQTLNLTKSLGDSELNVPLPLIPITVPRRVTAAMGNIIRRIQIGDTPEDHTPASEELENSIRCFSERLSLKERLHVWALVTPREIWVDQPQTTRGKTIFSQIENGARLHRVLSGGGGWGAKQGLLSLDPHSTYSQSEQASQLFIPDEGDFEAEKQAVLGHIVKPGDVVQFFIYRAIDRLPPRKRQFDLQDLQETRALFDSVHGPRTSIFGTIPSTMDAMPVPRLPTTSTTASKSDRPTHMLVHTHFGALSELGISLTITNHNTAGTAPSFGAKHLGTVVQTKLDVPYVRFGWEPSLGKFLNLLRMHDEAARLRDKRTQARIRLIALDEPEAGDEGGRGRVQYWRVPLKPERKEEDGKVETRPEPVAFDRVSGLRPLKRSGTASDGNASGGPVHEEGGKASRSLNLGPESRVQGARSPQDGVDGVSEKGPELSGVESDQSGQDGSASGTGPEVPLFDKRSRQFRFRRHDSELLEQRAHAPSQAPIEAPVPGPAQAEAASVSTTAPPSPVVVPTRSSARRIIRAVSVDDKPGPSPYAQMRYGAWRNMQRREAALRHEQRKQAGEEEVGMGMGMGMGMGNSHAEGEAEAEMEARGFYRSGRRGTVDYGSRPWDDGAMTDAGGEAKVWSERPFPSNVDTAGSLPPVRIRRLETGTMMVRSLRPGSSDERTAVNGNDSKLTEAGGEEVRVGMGMRNAHAEGEAEAEREVGDFDRSSRQDTVDDDSSTRSSEAMTNTNVEAETLSKQTSSPDVDSANPLPPMPFQKPETNSVTFHNLRTRPTDEPPALNEDDSKLADAHRDGEGSTIAEQGVPFATQADYQSLFSSVPHKLFDLLAAKRHRRGEREIDGGGGGERLANRRGEREGEREGEGGGEGRKESGGEAEGEEMGGRNTSQGLRIIKVMNHIKRGLKGKSST